MKVRRSLPSQCQPPCCMGLCARCSSKGRAGSEDRHTGMALFSLWQLRPCPWADHCHHLGCLMADSAGGPTAARPGALPATWMRAKACTERWAGGSSHPIDWDSRTGNGGAPIPPQPMALPCCFCRGLHSWPVMACGCSAHRPCQPHSSNPLRSVEHEWVPCYHAAAAGPPPGLTLQSHKVPRKPSGQQRGVPIRLWAACEPTPDPLPSPKSGGGPVLTIVIISAASAGNGVANATRAALPAARPVRRGMGRLKNCGSKGKKGAEAEQRGYEGEGRPMGWHTGFGCPWLPTNTVAANP